MNARIPRERLGVQLHCLRSQLATDFDGTLARVAALGLSQVELCYFPGFAGNPWGDFGAAGEIPAPAIDDSLQAHGLGCVATHCLYRHLAPENLDATIAWTLDAGSPALVLAALPPPAAAGLAAWQDHFGWLNTTGRRIVDSGLAFAYHTQNDVWQDVDGALLANEMFRIVNPALCRIELDPSGALVHGSDWSRPVLQHPNRYLAFHLRDGRRPDRPVPWLPALPLGEGDVDWQQTLQVAAAAGIPCYLLEMELAEPDAVFPALRASLAYLESTHSL